MIRIFSLAVTVLALALPVSVSASPIGGTLDIAGAFQPTKNGVATQNMAQSNGIDFAPLQGGSGTFTASNGAGDLTSFSGHSGTIKDLSFAPFSSVLNFFTITVGSDTLTFDLTGITINARNSNHLDLSGTGTIHLTGFTDTTGTWDLDAESTNGASPKSKFSWTALIDPPIAAPDAAPVPEPTMLALLAVPLLGLGLLRRSKKTA